MLSRKLRWSWGGAYKKGEEFANFLLGDFLSAVKIGCDWSDK